MQLLFGQWVNPYLRLPVRTVGYLLLAIYLLALLIALYSRKAELNRLRWKKTIFLLGLLVGAFIFNNFPILSFEVEFLPLALVPTLLAALLGAVPAGVVALGGGLGRGAFLSHRFSHSLEMALFGLFVGYLIRQDYRGRLPALLRQPIVAVTVACGMFSPMLLVSLYAYEPGPALSALLRSMALLPAQLSPVFLESFGAGAALQFLLLLWPGFRPASQYHPPPPYSRSLNRRLLVFFLPLILVIFAVLLYAVNVTAISVATGQTITQAARDASKASERIPFFFQTGQSLITEFARDETLRQPDNAARQNALGRDMHIIAFFSQLSLVDKDLRPLSIYPPEGDTTLSARERVLAERAMETGAPQVSVVHQTSGRKFVISFIVPLQEGEPSGALIGRVDLESNPVMQGILADLQKTMGAGVGFIVDERGQVALHPDRGAIFSPWQVQFSEPGSRGQAYEATDSEGTKHLIYSLTVEGYPWTVVISVPYEVVLTLAAKISAPLLIILFLAGLGMAALIPLATSRFTRPLEALAKAATQIARGDLEVPVRLRGEDEVGRLGEAIEEMRRHLKKRLEELSMLLEIGQMVSASLDLEQGLAPILTGAMRATFALSARIILLPGEWRQERQARKRSSPLEAEKAIIIRLGEKPRWERAPHLDKATLQVINTRRPLPVPNILRAGNLIDRARLESGLRAAIGLPVFAQENIIGVMWVEYPSPRQFSEPEIGFLSTLASQAAIVIQNARLLEGIESERSRLAAILSSTTDAILVADCAGRVILANPAAELTFNLKAQDATGKALSQAIAHEEARDWLMQPFSGDEPMTKEINLSGGRVLYANASPILDGEGQVVGRVAVMRDITHLKELDSMKTDFVNTVSHDLRSPLTFMRGYTTMIPMVGQVNEKQEEFIENIIRGIDQMTELIDDLLDIGRIEAGVGVNMRPCHVDEIIREVLENMRGQADIKRLTLKVKLPDGLSPITGDQTLLRQAITNLVDNAIKYTPSGSVEVGAEEKDEQLIIHVRDTGLGIAPADQIRLFEKFYRVKRRETANINGSGLGLAIVKSIVERHEGRVWVESKLNEGSTFYIALPGNLKVHRT